MRRRPLPSSPSAHDAPIAVINTTPLIDVMLVLLVMVVICIPMMNHKIAIPLPATGPSANHPPLVARVDLDAAGGLRWDGMPTDLASLPARLADLQRRDPLAQLQLSADGEARYEDYDRLLAVVKRAGIERLGLVGNEAFAHDLDR